MSLLSPSSRKRRRLWLDERTNDLSGWQQQCCYLNTNEKLDTVPGKLGERFHQVCEIARVTFHFPSNMLHLPMTSNRFDETSSNDFFFLLLLFLLTSGFSIHTLAPRPFKLSLVVFPVYWLIKLTRTNLANIYKPLGARYDRRYKYRSSISQAVSYARCKRRGAVFVNRRLRSRGVS